MVRLWRSEFGLESRLSPAATDRFGRIRYAVRTEGNGAIQAAEELAFARAGRRADDRTAYLRGAFQGTGSVSVTTNGAGSVQATGPLTVRGMPVNIN